jgi:ornithine cyclodeaminase/alanine dehydrogenase-like protein (mu-crystallin family)
VRVLVLSRAEIERLLDPRELIDALRRAFRALTTGQVNAAPRNQLSAPGEAFLLTMPGRTGEGPMTVKIVTLFEGNAARGIPAHLATIGLYDGETGACRAFMDGTHITAVRTSAAVALACDLLAREDSRTLAIVGAGVQGEHHLRALPLVRGFEEIRVASTRFADAERVAAADPRARAVRTAEEAVRGAGVVALTSSAPQPVIEPRWIGAGTHVSSVGYRPPGGELPPELARSARLFVETRAAFAPPPVGCAELQGLDPDGGTELGEVLAGTRPGRERDDEVTVYKAMGHVAEDIAAAELVYAAALREGAGTTVEL